MARVTVEDCVDKVPNRFDLVLLAAQRAREISGGAELTIDRDRDKNPVVALREIAETTVRPKILHESVVQSLQRVLPDEEDEADEIEAVGDLVDAIFDGNARHGALLNTGCSERRALRREAGASQGFAPAHSRYKGP